MESEIQGSSTNDGAKQLKNLTDFLTNCSTMIKVKMLNQNQGLIFLTIPQHGPNFCTPIISIFFKSFHDHNKL